MADDLESSYLNFAVGYRVENPEAPPEERRFVPINPDLQAKAEKIFHQMRQEALLGK